MIGGWALPLYAFALGGVFADTTEGWKDVHMQGGSTQVKPGPDVASLALLKLLRAQHISKFGLLENEEISSRAAMQVLFKERAHCENNSAGTYLQAHPASACGL